MAKARRDVGLSQEQMAARMGVSAKTVAAWETDRNQPRDFEDRLKLWAEITDVTVIFLLGLAESGKSRRYGQNLRDVA